MKEGFYIKGKNPNQRKWGKHDTQGWIWRPFPWSTRSRKKRIFSFFPVERLSNICLPAFQNYLAQWSSCPDHLSLLLLWLAYSYFNTVLCRFMGWISSLCNSPLSVEIQAEFAKVSKLVEPFLFTSCVYTSTKFSSFLCSKFTLFGKRLNFYFNHLKKVNLLQWWKIMVPFFLV